MSLAKYIGDSVKSIIKPPQRHSRRDFLWSPRTIFGTRLRPISREAKEKMRSELQEDRRLDQILCVYANNHKIFSSGGIHRARMMKKDQESIGKEVYLVHNHCYPPMLEMILWTGATSALGAYVASLF